MEQLITTSDLLLLKDLYSRSYSKNSFLSNATEKEKIQLFELKEKLKIIAENFQNKYNNIYGPFEISVTSGNPIAIGGHRLKRIWSGIFKGGVNKQYSAQISFVINPNDLCLDVGFYFGRASAHSLSKQEKLNLETQLKELGTILSTELTSDKELFQIYNELFDYGFKAFSKGERVTNYEWIERIKKNPEASEIIYSIPLNELGYIDNTTVDLIVSMIIGLMNPIPILFEEKFTNSKRQYKPLTPEQRAKQAERRTLIGNKGELFAMEYERARINEYTKSEVLPDHVALRSTDFSYDILSCSPDLGELYIEVKTTTRLWRDPESKKFYISSNEYEYYKQNKHRYRLYRVYDIDGDPHLEVVDMEQLVLNSNVYTAVIQ